MRCVNVAPQNHLNDCEFRAHFVPRLKYFDYEAADCIKTLNGECAGDVSAAKIGSKFHQCRTGIPTLSKKLPLTKAHKDNHMQSFVFAFCGFSLQILLLTWR